MHYLLKVTVSDTCYNTAVWMVMILSLSLVSVGFSGVAWTVGGTRMYLKVIWEVLGLSGIAGKFWSLKH